MSLDRPGRKEAREHVRDARGFNNIETRAVIKFFPPQQGKAPKKIHAILTEILACFLPGRGISPPVIYMCNTKRFSVYCKVAKYTIYFHYSHHQSRTTRYKKFLKIIKTFLYTVVRA